MAELTYRPLESGDAWFSYADTYKKLLFRPEWRSRRKVILFRDKYVCTACNMYETYNYQGVPFTGDVLGTFSDGTPFLKFTKASKSTRLHIHHKYYVLTRAPWEYEDSALVCLCQDCHSKEHESKKIDTFKDEIAKQANELSDDFLVCPKCGGSGFLSHYNYHMDGVCFGCNGYCFVKRILISKKGNQIGSFNEFFPDRER